VNLELRLDPSHHSLSMEDLTLGSWSVRNKILSRKSAVL
jgi:hypothetical protein